MNRPRGTSSATPAALRELIDRELQYPASIGDFLDALAKIDPGEPLLKDLLLAKDDHHRHAYYVKSEQVWYRRFSWKIMRPLFVAAVLAAIGFSLQRVVDPTLGFASFVLGAVAVYLSIQFFAHRWIQQDEDKLKEVEHRYRERLQELRGRVQSDG